MANQITRRHGTIIQYNQTGIEIRRVSADGKHRGKQGDLIAAQVTCYISPVSGSGPRTPSEDQMPQGFDLGDWNYGRFDAGLDLRNDDTIYNAQIPGLQKNHEALVLQVVGVRDYSNMSMNAHISMYLTTTNR